MLNNNISRILVTGASGFIGSHLTARLIKGGYQVRAIFRSNNIPDRFKVDNNLCEYVKADLLNKDDINRIVDGCDAVIHLAGLAIDWGPFEIFRKNNYTATVNLLRDAEVAGCRTFIYISSAAVHGFGLHDGTKETGPYYKLKYSYPITKKMAEDFALKQNSPNFDVTVIRPGNVYGPGDNTSTYEMFRQIRKGVMGYIGGGKSYTCPVYIDDLCEGIFLALTAKNIKGEIITISDGQKVRWKDYVKRMYEVSGSTRKPVNIPIWVAYLAAYSLTAIYNILRLKKAPALTLYRVDQASKHYHFDNTKAYEILGFSPTVFYQEGLKKTVDAFIKDND